MPDAVLLKALLEFAKSGASDAAKERLKELLHEKTVVSGAIRKTVSAFSTQLPGLDAALQVWIREDAFVSGMLDLYAGKTLPENVTAPDAFVGATGLTFGAADLEVVAKVLRYFYTEVRTGLISAGQGLSLIDNAVLETLRQLDSFRAEVADSKRSGTQIASVVRYPIDLIQSLASKEGWSSGINFAPDIPINLDLPPQVDKLASRPDTVQRVVELLSKHVCYAMSGGSGSGKTQLAVLVAGSFSGRKTWVRLGADVATASFTFELALSKLLARDATLSAKQWCESIVQQLPPSSLFVLDDYPRTNGSTGLDEMLVALCNACSQSGVRVVVTAADLLSHTVRQALGELVISEPVPDFSESEIRDLLRQYGATETFLTSSWAEFVQLAARRNAMLLVQAALYLRDRNWATDQNVFTELLNGTFANELDGPTVNRILETVPDGSTRELLYRIKLIGWPFGPREVRRVSAIDPPITLPMERLHTLVGLWVQRDSDREFIVSPLVSRLADNLPEHLQKHIYSRLARGILQQKVLGPVEVSKAVNYFVQADEFNSAAAALAIAYHAMITEPDIADPVNLSAIWAGMQHPPAIALDKRVFLRSMQVIIRHRLGTDTRYERADLERLLEEAERTGTCHFAIVSAAVFISTSLGDQYPALAISLLQKGLQALRTIEEEQREIDLEEMLLRLLWMCPAWIRNDSDYLAWFSAVQELTQPQVERWVAFDIADVASQAAAAGIWSRGVDSKISGPQWADVDARLKSLERWAASHRAPMLQTSALVGQIVVAAEYQNNLQLAQSTANRAISEIAIPKARFLVAECIARQHDYYGSVSDALYWYDQALQYDTGRPASQVAILTMAGVAALPLDERLSHQHFRRGVELAERGSVDYATEIKVRGELAISLWNSGERRAAYELWKCAAERLLIAKEDTDRWKGLFMIFGNCAGYFANQGKAVTDSMTVPFTGIFLRDLRRVADLYEEEKSSLLPAQLALFAQDVHAFEDATNWACRVPSIDGPLATAARSLMLETSIGARLRDGEYLKIIEVASRTDLETPREPINFVGLEFKEQQRLAEAMTARLSVLALLIEVVRIALHDRPRSQAIARELFERSCRLGNSDQRFEFWRGVADAFESVVCPDPNSASMTSKAAEAARAQTSSQQAIFSIAAMLTAAPMEALRFQLELFPWLETLFSPTTYHFTVARLVPEFWLHSLDIYPMHFGFPVRTRKALNEANLLENDRWKVRSVLRAIMLSLGVRMSADLDAWLGQFAPSERAPG